LHIISLLLIAALLVIIKEPHKITKRSVYRYQQITYAYRNVPIMYKDLKFLKVKIAVFY
jgi:hypothetical protein